uniref:ATPase inhibitor, mitochondrial n=1 Tax=Oryctolagus cuniculus TaxID=9986 RepID=A0A5F9DQH0_RABIT
MAGSALVARARLGTWGARAIQTRGFVSDKPEDIHGKAGSIREAGGAFGKREQAEEERYFRLSAVSGCPRVSSRVSGS